MVQTLWASESDKCTKREEGPSCQRWMGRRVALQGYPPLIRRETMTETLRDDDGERTRSRYFDMFGDRVTMIHYNERGSKSSAIDFLHLA